MTLCGVGWGGGYDQLCCPASPKLLLGLDLGLGCDNYPLIRERELFKGKERFYFGFSALDLSIHD